MVPSSTCAATVIGSTPAQGCEPWVCLPVISRVHSSALAMNGPARTPICPACRRDQTCRPSTASGLKSSQMPSSSMRLAPATSPATGGPSSAGWNTNITSPASCSRMPASASATPIRIATCRSWPQACITPTGWPRYSATGLGSVQSARTSFLPKFSRPQSPPAPAAACPVPATHSCGPRIRRTPP